MTDQKPTTRRELARPAQLLGLAFIAALFAGVVTAFSLGIAQTPTKPTWTAEQIAQEHAKIVTNALTVSAVMAGIVFIAVLLVMSLLLLAVKPSDFAQPVDRPVLYPPEEAQDAPATAAGANPSAEDAGTANGGPGGDA